MRTRDDHQGMKLADHQGDIIRPIQGVVMAADRPQDIEIEGVQEEDHLLLLNIEKGDIQERHRHQGR